MVSMSSASFSNDLDKLPDGRLNGIESVEYSRLIFLQIAIVGQWETLQDCKQADQMAIHPARLAANEFGDVGVLLVRHHTAAGADSIRKFHEPKFLRRPE